MAASLKPSKSIDKIGRVSAESVKKCTGKDWTKWVEILDGEGAKNLTHQQIVALLKTKYKLRPWWQQGVTLGYEIFIGRRKPGQTQKGDYATVATMTFNLDHKKIWKAFTSQKGLATWLQPLDELKLKPGQSFEVYGGVFGEIRTLKPGARVRMTWQETDWAKASVVQFHVVPKKKGTCMAVIDHQGLHSEALKAQMLKHWKKALKTIHDGLKISG